MSEDLSRRSFVKLASAFPAAAVTATLTLREDGHDPIEGLAVTVLHVEPDDVVILTVSDHIRDETVRRIEAAWSRAVPGTRAIVVDSGMTVAGVLRGVRR